MNDGRIGRYVVSGRKNVKGWLTRIDAELFSTIMLAQLRLGVSGGAMEIGVHHGCSFIALSLCMGEGEKAIAIDVFEQQHLNLDGSGKGDREAFEQNLDCYGDCAKAEIIVASSLNLKADDIKALSPPLRFVSLDGGHWYDAVMNDLTLTASCAGPECVIALDDFFNPDFPEVAAAYYAWRGSNSDWSPLCISHGKLYLCRGSMAGQYYSEMDENRYLRFHRKKNVPFLGNAIPIFTGRHGGVRGLVGQYTSFYAPSFHEYVKARLQAFK